jgi:hypothetical protein
MQGTSLGRIAIAAALFVLPGLLYCQSIEVSPKAIKMMQVEGFNSFGNFIKGIRFQYWIGVVEFNCVDENAARRRWEKLAKASQPVASTDHAYPYMALAKMDPEEGKARASAALEALQRQLATAPPSAKGTLLYNQGLLQMIADRKTDAAASFHAGAAAGPPGMVEYLNLDAIRLLDAGQ